MSQFQPSPANEPDVRSPSIGRDLLKDPTEPRTDPWEHRSVRMRCRTCMWHSPKSQLIGRCRRHAPTMNGYPAVFSAEDWCGDHKLDEEVA